LRSSFFLLPGVIAWHLLIRLCWKDGSKKADSVTLSFGFPFFGLIHSDRGRRLADGSGQIRLRDMPALPHRPAFHPEKVCGSRDEGIPFA